MTRFNVGDKVRRNGKYGWPPNSREIFEVVAVDRRGDATVRLLGNPLSWAADGFDLVEEAAEVPDPQQALNEAAFEMVKWARRKGWTGVLDEAVARVFHAAVALEVSFEPPKPEMLYSPKFEEVATPSVAREIKDVRRLSFLWRVEAVFPWDGTRFGDPITGDELDELLRDES